MQQFSTNSKIDRRRLRSKRQEDDPLSQEGTRVAQKFVWVQVRHIPRMENSRVDALAKLATTPQEDLDKRVPVEHLMEPSIDVNGDEALPVMTAPSWIDPIWDYLLNEILPSDLKEASKLRAMSARFALLQGDPL